MARQPRPPRPPRPEITRVRPADDRWAVVTIVGGKKFQKEPCLRCPWRRDAPIGAFPADAFRSSAETVYDLAKSTFACHSTPDDPHTCAGFLLAGSSDNLTVRMRGELYNGVNSPTPLYDSYREMAIANGVDPADPAIAPCRGDRRITYTDADGVLRFVDHDLDDE